MHRFKGLDLYHKADDELVEGSMGIIKSHRHLLSPLRKEEIEESEALTLGIPPCSFYEGSEKQKVPQTSGPHSVRVTRT